MAWDEAILDRPTPEQIAIYRRMTPAQKWTQVWALYASARALKTEGVRRQHPEWTDERVNAEVRDIFLHAST